MEILVDRLVDVEADPKDLPDVYPEADVAHVLRLVQESGSDSCHGQTGMGQTNSALNLGVGAESAMSTVPAGSKTAPEAGIKSPPAVDRKHRPGVVLLGRGNSFSLGRSEVLFLPRTRPKRGTTSRTPALQESTSSHTRTSSSAKHGLATVLEGGNSLSIEAANRPSPPQLSKPNTDVCGPAREQDSAKSVRDDSAQPLSFVNSITVASSLDIGQSSSQYSLDNGSRDGSKHFDQGSRNPELDALWRRAELVMCGRQQAVLNVLAQFGVGGEDTAQEEEEEEMWQLIESKTLAASG